jgi:hypothetical protein
VRIRRRARRKPWAPGCVARCDVQNTLLKQSMRGRAQLYQGVINLGG